MLLTSPDVDVDEFARRTGWVAKREGMCKGEVCVPFAEDLSTGRTIAAAVIAERLGMALVVDEEHGLFCLGPEAGPRTRRLTSAVAPEIVLSDFLGGSVSLDSFRGRKVLLATWATY